MKLWLSSDLHLDHVENQSVDLTPPPDADVCVLAGDLGWTLDVGIETAHRIADGRQCVVVAGNHDFYSAHLPPPRPTMDEIWQKAREKADKLGVFVLENDSVEIHGVRFLGCSLWTDGWSAVRERYESSSHAIRAMGKMMNDYRCIRTGPSSRHRLETGDTRRMHTESVRWLTEQLADDALPTVVVTHHGPDPGAGTHYRDLDQAYWSDLRRVIETGKPDVWCHGHTHESRDDVVGVTRMASNPLGYPHEQCGFDVDRLIDVETMGWRGPR